ncbi:hypothetical protein LB543_01435 [Mesorhizobium sp. ESP7-2]|uniref:hypothetical protein n=1 Tax=Mesorhizobium sp. ESP7-2 TaxID=2876622 RepID=UPI001CCA76F4|nr:hypothetical protein [Mesorhizobium sp. ESP7-2]MBZ9705391.1 hypothetical protein [Mesorhizobium sp. ESP7-2]
MYFFAFVDAADTVFGPEHEVEDLLVVAYKLAQQEGEFATLDLTVKNPRVGLLASGRKQWMLMSWRDEANPTDGTRLLFRGRLVGIPTDLLGNQVTLQFDAKPAGYDATKLALAQTLKVAPFFDPMFLRPESRDDPDAVIEAMSVRYHADRVDHAVTVSDMLVGEDGLIDFGTVAVKDSLGISIGQPPLRRVSVEASVTWDQVAVGTVEISPVVLKAFQTAGSGSKYAIRSLTGDGIMQDWPKEDGRIGGGWAFGLCSIVRTDGFVVPEDFHQVVMADSMAAFPVWSMKPTLIAAYDVSRPREERLTFTLEADCQALLSDAGDDEILAVKVSGKADEAVDPADTDNPQGAIPIGDVRRRAYFPTARGLRSLGYLLALARGNILERSRAVEISFTVPFRDGVDLSCRKNASIADPRIPGGTAAGKVIRYEMNGFARSHTVAVTIGCTVGKGNTVTTMPGEPVYAEEGILEPGIQAYAGQTVMPIAGEVTFEDFSTVQPVDDGVDFFDMRATDMVESLIVYNPVPVQAAVVDAFKPDISAAVDALNQVFTRFDGDMKKLTIGRDDPPFLTPYAITVSQLMVPKTIDLEAA